jgi:hypothetical protein
MSHKVTYEMYEALCTKIQKLEDAMDHEIKPALKLQLDTYEMTYYIYGPQRTYHFISLADAICKIIDHLGLRFERKAETAATVTLQKV